MRETTNAGYRNTEARGVDDSDSIARTRNSGPRELGEGYVKQGGEGTMTQARTGAGAAS